MAQKIITYTNVTGNKIKKGTCQRPILGEDNKPVKPLQFETVDVTYVSTDGKTWFTATRPCEDGTYMVRNS